MVPMDTLESDSSPLPWGPVSLFSFFATCKPTYAELLLHKCYLRGRGEIS